MMRRAGAILACLILTGGTAWAGGPLLVTGPLATQQGRPFTWNAAAMPIRYVIDGGPLSTAPAGNVVRDNAYGRALIANAVAAWQSVPTATISFQDAGLTTIGNGDIDTVSEFDAAVQECENAAQSPIIFDSDGSLLQALGGDPFTIGFGGPCTVDEITGHIGSALVFLNGRFIDGVSSSFTSNSEITADQFEEAAAHEIGHFIGLDHSNVNSSILGQPENNCTQDFLAGRPLMYPFVYCQAKKSAGLPILAADDVAWLSQMYPSATFSSMYGVIRGTVFFDGTTQFQGASVTAQQVNDPLTPADESIRVVVSAISGLYFTGNPGQSVTGDNTGGSRFGSRDVSLIGYYEIPVPAGTYTVRSGNVGNLFDGSGVGPLDPHPSVSGPGAGTLPGTITVSAGQIVSNVDFTFGGGVPQFDQFEDGVTAENRCDPARTEVSFVTWFNRRILG